jgi:hypothetical protein
MAYVPVIIGRRPIVSKKRPALLPRAVYFSDFTVTPAD